MPYSAVQNEMEVLLRYVIAGIAPCIREMPAGGWLIIAHIVKCLYCGILGYDWNSADYETLELYIQCIPHMKRR